MGRPVFHWGLFVIILLALAAVLSSAPPQTPATPAPAAVAAQGPWEFTSEVGAFLIVVKQDKATQFEAALQKLRAAFAQPTASSARKQQASGWRVLKSTEPVADGALTYLFLIEPVTPKLSYDPIALMRELMPADTQAVFDQLQDAWVSATRIGLKDLMRMGGAGR